MSEEELGFDPTIAEDGRRYTTIQRDGQMERFVRKISSSDNVRSLVGQLLAGRYLLQMRLSSACDKRLMGV